MQVACRANERQSVLRERKAGNAHAQIDRFGECCRLRRLPDEKQPVVRGIEARHLVRIEHRVEVVVVNAELILKDGPFGRIGGDRDEELSGAVSGFDEAVVLNIVVAEHGGPPERGLKVGRVV